MRGQCLTYVLFHQILIKTLNKAIEPAFKSPLMPLIRLSFLWLILFFSHYISANSPTFRFTNFSTEQGLPNPNVLKVLQDTKGFIWAATQEGLYRYDGYSFKTFTHDPDDISSLPDIYINTIYVDSKGVLWVGTDGGLSEYDASTETFTNYSNQKDNVDSLSNNIVMSIVDGKNDTLWIATLGGGLEKFNRDTKTFSHYRHNPKDTNTISSDSLYSLLMDRQGILWIGSRNSGLNRFDPTTSQFKRYQHNSKIANSISHNRVYTLWEDPDDNLWVGTRGGGLNLFNRSTETFQHYRHHIDDPSSLSSDQVFAIFTDKKGALWVGVDKSGLNRLNKKTRTFDRFQQNPQDKYSLANNNVYSIIQDRTGLIWLATLGEGIVKFDPGSERFGLVKFNPNRPNGINEGVIWSVLKDSAGIIWVGTENGLSRYDPIKNQYQLIVHVPDKPHSLSDSDVRSLLEDSAGNLWIGTNNGGLNLLTKKERSNVNKTPETYRFIHYRNVDKDLSSLSENHVSVIHQDNYDNIWVGTQGGLNLFNLKNDNFIRYRHSDKDPTSISQNDINALYSTQDNSLWVGTLGGLNKFDHDKQTFTRFQKQPGNISSLSHNTVNSLVEGESGILWIATNGGLNKFDTANEKFTHFRKTDGLDSDRIFAVMKDRDNKLWLAEDGITLFDPKREVMTNNIGIEAGCMGTNQGAYFTAQDGQLFFASVGYCAFYPQAVKNESEPPEVVFTDFRLLNKSVTIAKENNSSPLSKVINYTQSITLKSRDNVLSFEFSGLHYYDSKSNQYQYKLDNFNQEWIDTTSNNRQATFTNLSPGEYIFRVRASNNSGHWSTQERSVALTILPPLWRTWWAYIFYILILVSLILGFVWSQRRKVLHARFLLNQENKIVKGLKKVDKLKDEFLTIASHEFRTPLNGIIGISEMLLLSDNDELSSETKNELGLVAKSGRVLSKIISDVLDYSSLKSNNTQLNIQSIHVLKTIDKVVQSSKDLCKEKNLKISYQIPLSLPKVNADRDRLSQILLNLIDNAIKFTASGYIKVVANHVDDVIQFQVIDSGIGIAKGKQFKIFREFIQVDSSNSRNYEGTGLGLPITKCLVELHGGTIKVVSELNHGATFIFTLPICQHNNE